MKKFFDWLGDHWLLIFPFLMLAVAIPISVWQESVWRHERLIAQCVADGFKEYECEAMLK